MNLLEFYGVAFQTFSKLNAILKRGCHFLDHMVVGFAITTANVVSKIPAHC